MFSFFKKSSGVSDISWLGIDIHSHILPAIDDGAKDIIESLSYIKKMSELGFSKLFFTPHIFAELYPNTNETIFSALNEVTNQLATLSLEVKVGAAAEHMVDYSFHINNNLMTLPGNRILIEMSYLSETPNIEQIIFELQVAGYTVILAHPERYNFYHKTLARYLRLREMGCLFQLNLLSVVGYYGKDVQQAANYLLDHKMYDLAGSDLHHHKHLTILDQSVMSGKLYNLIGTYEFKNKEFFA